MMPIVYRDSFTIPRQIYSHLLIRHQIIRSAHLNFIIIMNIYMRDYL